MKQTFLTGQIYTAQICRSKDAAHHEQQQSKPLSMQLSMLNSNATEHAQLKCN